MLKRLLDRQSARARAKHARAGTPTALVAAADALDAAKEASVQAGVRALEQGACTLGDSLRIAIHKMLDPSNDWNYSALTSIPTDVKSEVQVKLANIGPPWVRVRGHKNPQSE